MFLTSDTNKHPLSQLYGEGRHLWTGTEIHIRRVWFMVNYHLVQKDKYGEELRVINTVLLSDVQDLLNLAPMQRSLLSVYLMTPCVNSVDGGWDMARLMEIWEAPDQEDDRIQAKIYVKEDGSYYVDSLLRSTMDQRDSWKKLLDLPVHTRAQQGET